MTTTSLRKIRIILLGAVAATFLVAGLASCGHSGDRGWGANVTAEQFAKKRDKLVDRAARKLDLNAAQKDLLAKVGDKMFEQRKSLIGQTPDRQALIGSLIAGPKFDTTKAQALITEKTTVMQTKSPETLAAFAAFYDSLNAVQQQKVRDLVNKRHFGWGH
jgi:protein CpxP